MIVVLEFGSLKLSSNPMQGLPQSLVVLGIHQMGQGWRWELGPLF